MIPVPARRKPSRRVIACVAVMVLLAVLAFSPAAAQPGWSDAWYGHSLTTESPTSGTLTAEPTALPELPRLGVARLGPIEWDWEAMRQQLTERIPPDRPQSLEFVEKIGATTDEFLAALASDSPSLWLLLSPPNVHRTVDFGIENEGFISIARRQHDLKWTLYSQVYSLDFERAAMGIFVPLRQVWNPEESLLLIGEAQDPWMVGLLKGSRPFEDSGADIRALTLSDEWPRAVEFCDLIATMPRSPSLIVIGVNEGGARLVEMLKRQSCHLGIDIVIVGEDPLYGNLVEKGLVIGWFAPDYAQVLDPALRPQREPRTPEERVRLASGTKWMERTQRISTP